MIQITNREPMDPQKYCFRSLMLIKKRMIWVQRRTKNTNPEAVLSPFVLRSTSFPLSCACVSNINNKPHALQAAECVTHCKINLMLNDKKRKKKTKMGSWELWERNLHNLHNTSLEQVPSLFKCYLQSKSAQYRRVKVINGVTCGTVFVSTEGKIFHGYWL